MRGRDAPARLTGSIGDTPKSTPRFPKNARGATARGP
jgi:hypothetical protein